MIRDLTEIAVELVREERHGGSAREGAAGGGGARARPAAAAAAAAAEFDDDAASIREQAQRTREKLREQLREGRLDHKQLEIDVRERSFPSFEIIAGSSVEEVDINVKDMLPGPLPGAHAQAPRAGARGARRAARRKKSRSSSTWTASRAPRSSASSRPGIIFLDEIDKVAGREGGHGPDVSREGVQRDILPIVEGTTVNTKYGMVKTDHILFIAAGAFHVSKPSDLIPELQGRFPDPRRARAARPRGFRPHPHRAEERAGAPVHGAALDRRGDADLHARRDRADRRRRDAGQRAHREHRRAAAAHRDGEAARQRVVRRAGSRRRSS